MAKFTPYGAALTDDEKNVALIAAGYDGSLDDMVLKQGIAAGYTGGVGDMLPLLSAGGAGPPPPTQATGGADLDLSFVEDSAISSTDLTVNWTVGSNTLTYAIQGTPLPAGLSVSSAGLLTGTPTDATADNTYTLRGTDQVLRTTDDTFTLEVTALPLVPAYTETYGQGDRTALISGVSTLSNTGSMSNAVDGATGSNSTDAWWFSGTYTVAGETVRFTMNDPQYMTEVSWLQLGASGLGTWKWQASNDAVVWVDMSADFVLGGFSGTSVTTLTPADQTGYIYWQLLGISGSTSNATFNREITFKTVSTA
jgi:hypothetical protein